MKDRGKAVETYNGNYFAADYYSSSDLPCRKHPSSSSVGICAICLKDRLIKLVCSDCGEQRLSSCSCSEISSNRNSCTVEVGSVGRISFLIENERGDQMPHSISKPKSEGKAEEVFLLKRSSSSHVEIKRSGFWRFGRLFRKKRDKGCERSVGGFDDKSDLWVFDYVGVPRSKSLCSFRGGGFYASEDGVDHMSVSGARSSGVNGGLSFDSEKKSGFSEAEARKSGFDGEKKGGVLEPESGLDFKGLKKGLDFNGAKKRVHTLKESDFTALDESGFIDLKLDLSSQSKPEFSALKMSDLSVSDLDSGLATSLRGGSFHEDHECGASFRSVVGDGLFNNESSCRITVNERGIKKSRKSLKVWRWIFNHHPSCRTAKKDEDHSLKA